ncbi:MAG: hypothetical protein HQL88_08210 [Magnetococcales bacterium]|nr:hypothetical protein [Magnetococcales bacterium]
MNDLEWDLLRKPLIILTVLLLLALAAVTGGLYYQEEMAVEVEAMQSRLKTLLDKRRAQEEQIRLLGQYKPGFDAYQSSGVFHAEEPRLRWVNQLLEVEKSLHLPEPVRFKLDVRKPFTPDYPLPTRTDRLYASVMEVRLGLVHEEDLLYFLKQLAKHGRGVYDVKECALGRTQPSAEPGDAGKRSDMGVGVHLNAVCQIRWYWYDLGTVERKKPS